MKAYIQIWLATWQTVLCDEVSPIKEDILFVCISLLYLLQLQQLTRLCSCCISVFSTVLI